MKSVSLITADSSGQLLHVGGSGCGFLFEPLGTWTSGIRCRPNGDPGREIALPRPRAVYLDPVKGGFSSLDFLGLEAASQWAVTVSEAGEELGSERRFEETVDLANYGRLGPSFSYGANNLLLAVVDARRYRQLVAALSVNMVYAGAPGQFALYWRLANRSGTELSRLQICAPTGVNGAYFGALGEGFAGGAVATNGTIYGLRWPYVGLVAEFITGGSAIDSGSEIDLQVWGLR